MAHLPEGLRQFLARRLEDLPPEARPVLDAASVMGEEFAAAAVAAGAQCAVEAVDEVCERLATIYGWFTEGVDTHDMQEAKGQWETLSGQASYT